MNGLLYWIGRAVDCRFIFCKVWGAKCKNGLIDEKAKGGLQASSARSMVLT